MDMTQTHPDHTPLQRLEIDKARATEVVRVQIENARQALVGLPGQQSDRDRKADLALNALNPAPEVTALREAALAFLAMPAQALGVTPLELATRIKSKRDNETAALMALDAYRIDASRAIVAATTHDQVEAALAALQQGVPKALAIAA